MLYLCAPIPPKPRAKRGSPEQDLVKSGSERKCLQTCSQELEDFAGNVLNLKETASELKVGD